MADTRVADVSIIIPVSGRHSEFVRSAVESCFSGAVRPLEVIVVDDGATPAASTNLRDLHSMEVHCIYAPARAGRCVARNLGVYSANAPYVYFLDADDTLHPTAVQDFCRHTDAEIDLVYADYDFIMPDGSLHSPLKAPWADFRNIAPAPEVLVYGSPARAISAQTLASLPQPTRQRILSRMSPAQRASALQTASPPDRQMEANMSNVFNIGLLSRKQVFLKVGGFDPDMVVGEYWDFFLRVAALRDTKIRKNERPFFTARGDASVLSDAISRMTFADRKVRAMVAGGYYGQTVDNPLPLHLGGQVTHPAGLGRRWENATRAQSDAGVREEAWQG